MQPVGQAMSPQLPPVLLEPPPLHAATIKLARTERKKELAERRMMTSLTISKGARTVAEDRAPSKDSNLRTFAYVMTQPPTLTGVDTSG